MRKFITALGLMLTLVISVMAETVYVIDATTVTSFGAPNAYGITVSNDGGKTWAAGKENTLKYSTGCNYTFTLPASAKITKMVVKGYDNYADADAYISAINGETQANDAYVFPKKNADDSYNMVTHTVNFTSAVTGSIVLRIGGKQCCLIVSLYSDEESESNSEDAYSLGYYANPATGSGITPTGATKVFNYPTSVSQMERLNRGVVAVPGMQKGVVVTWRLLGTDAPNTVFDVLRNGAVIASNLDKVTNYADNDGKLSDQYSVVAKVNGAETDRSEAVKSWNRIYKTLKLDRPAAVGGATYTPNDMSVGDVDGDGEYELFVKWDPSNSKDNSQTGKTSNVYIDAYKLNGTKLWRIDLGVNIRAGAHYTQFLVYDFDGDGKAEMICKTAPGSKDGKGNYVCKAGDDSKITDVDNSKDYRNSNGHLTGGEEFLTVFNGETGAAMHTIWYNPNRAQTRGTAGTYTGWGDSNYNRGERYLASVAYLDGQEGLPSAIMVRGYYTAAFVWAVDYRDGKLQQKWLHESKSNTTWGLRAANNNYSGEGGLVSQKTNVFGETSNTLFGQGAHSIAVGDVDGDGCDEIIFGAAALDHDGHLLHCTKRAHGDALHLADLIPDRDGLEVFMPHEEDSKSLTGKAYGYTLRDAFTGELLIDESSSEDNGRGLAADVVDNNRGYEFWSSASSDVWSATTKKSLCTSKPTTNFRIYWDGDLQDELFDGKYDSGSGKCSPIISKEKSLKHTTLLTLTGEAYGNSQTCNTTKSTPCLIADIFGDWREEIIMWDYSNPSVINIFSTNVPSAYRVPTLMHDHVYRMGITWQNTAYNQPPHLGYYLPDMFDKNYGIYSTNYADGIETVKTTQNDNAIYNLSGQRVSTPAAGHVYIRNGKKVIIK